LGALAALLIVLALAVELLYAATCGLFPALGVDLGPLAGSLSGSPILAGGGGVAFLLGVLVLGRAREGKPYATREVLMVLSAGAAVGFGVTLLVAVVRGWPPAMMTLLGAAGALESLLAVALAARLLTVPERRRALFVPGVLLTSAAGLFHVVLVTLSL
jgi:hypothetical protein